DQTRAAQLGRRARAAPALGLPRGPTPWRLCVDRRELPPAGQRAGRYRADGPRDAGVVRRRLRAQQARVSALARASRPQLAIYVGAGRRGAPGGGDAASGVIVATPRAAS